MNVAIAIGYIFGAIGLISMFGVIAFAITGNIALSAVIGAVSGVVATVFMVRSEDRRREWTVDRRKDKV